MARHSELEQSETKAQAALVTILSLTQITELKLLLDIGRSGHRFYDFVLTLLIACISLELLVGVIIIYIGNLHYYSQSTEKIVCCADAANCFGCLTHTCCKLPAKTSNYQTVTEATATELTASRRPTALAGGTPGNAGAIEETQAVGFDDGMRMESRLVSLFQLEQSDGNIEIARVKVADAEVKIIRSANYVKIVEDAFKKSPGNSDLEEELNRARDEMQAAVREREEGEAERKLAEAQQHHAFFLKEQQEDRQEKITFRKVSFWQHMATYLLYFIMLMNVFITTFGISGGTHNLAALSPSMTSPRNDSHFRQRL